MNSGEVKSVVDQEMNFDKNTKFKKVGDCIFGLHFLDYKVPNVPETNIRFEISRYNMFTGLFGTKYFEVRKQEKGKLVVVPSSESFDPSFYILTDHFLLVYNLKNDNGELEEYKRNGEKITWIFSCKKNGSFQVEINNEYYAYVDFTNKDIHNSIYKKYPQDARFLGEENNKIFVPEKGFLVEKNGGFSLLHIKNHNKLHKVPLKFTGSKDYFERASTGDNSGGFESLID